MKLKARVAILLLILATFALSANAQREERYSVTIKKQQEKQSARWTLAAWMAQKERNRMMDLWLAKNSMSSPYEVLLEGRSLNYNVKIEPNDTTNENRYNALIGAYAGMAGVRGGYEKDSEDRSRWEGSLNFRLFGRQMQDTHINIQYGMQALDDALRAEKYQNQFAGVSANLYFTKYFGLTGGYQHIFPAESNLQNTMQGNRGAAGVFIDFGSLRIFGEWRREDLRISDSAATYDHSEKREGFGGGLQLYF
jgi:hypothetical protein